METLDKRVADPEALIADLPDLLNIRFERVNATLSEHTARFNLMDKQMGMLVRDMRDLRGGVTRQLVEQDKRLGGIEQKLDEQDRRLGGIEQKLGEQDRRLGTIEQQLGEVLSRLPKS